MKKFTPLNKLRRKNKVLLASFSQRLTPVNIVLTSWTYNIFPDNLWLAILLSKFNIKEIVNDLKRLITNHMKESKDPQKYIFFHSELSNISDLLFDKIFRELLSVQKYKEQLEALLLFDNLPDKHHWNRHLKKTKKDDELWAIISDAHYQACGFHSRISTSCGCFFTLCESVTGALTCAEGVPDRYQIINEYINTGKAQHESFLRMGLEMHYCNFLKDVAWNELFWKECFEKTSCGLISYDKIMPKQKCSDEEIKQIKDIVLKLHIFWFYYEKNTDYKYRDYAIFGIAKYAIDLCYKAIVEKNNDTSESNIVLRSIVEAYINLKYLLAKDEDSLWKRYIEYGHGKAKQILTKYQKVDDTKVIVSTPQQILEFIADEVKDPELYVDINLGDFDKTDLRKRAEDGGTKDIYDKYYDILSTFTHSQWLGVRLHSFSICGNPLHRHHLLLNQFGLTNELVDITGDFYFFAKKLIDIVYSVYSLDDEFERYCKAFNKANSDFAINDLRSKIGAICDKYEVNTDIFCYLLKRAYNYTTGDIDEFISEFNISRDQGMSQLKKIGFVCKELGMPNVSMVCLNKNNMPYSFVFNGLDNCDTTEKRRAYFIYEYNVLVASARSFPISILSSKPQEMGE
jgi:hypothetical protein